MGARWHRYKALTPSDAPDDRQLWAILPAALVWDRILPARAVRLYGGLYLALYDPRNQIAAGWVDPHHIAATVRISPSLYRRYARLLEDRGWIRKRRTTRRKHHANLVYIELNVAR